MQRVERHIINNDKNIDDLCFRSKNLYNYVNYILRQCYTGAFENIPEYKHLVEEFKINGKLFYKISEYKLSQHLASVNQLDYKYLPPQTSQQIIKLIYKNWKSFLKSIKNYWKNPKKYNGIPRLPEYKDKIKGRNIVVFTNQNAILKNDSIHFPKKSNLKPLKTLQKNFNQVRIIPRTNCYVIEVVYEKEKQEHDLNPELYLGIDIGVNNLATCVPCGPQDSQSATLTNNAGQRPLIISGRPLKSMNQYFNKMKAILQSYVGSKGTSSRIRKLTMKRNNKIEDYIHKSSRYIIDYCLDNKIKNIIIGYNKEWKQDVKIGSRNNQNFVQIPFLKLIDQIKYKGEEVGIEVNLIGEAYTSKCDALALEPIQKHEKYLGKRIKRGLFQSSTGNLVNADVNGSLNILRKAIGDVPVKELINRGVVITPVRINSSQMNKNKYFYSKS